MRQNFETNRSIEHVLLLARNLFELREYKKCSYVLKEHLSRNEDDQSLIFYYYYSIWMAGLIRKEEEIYETEAVNTMVNRAPIHCEIQLLEREFKKLYEKGRLTSGINLYLYGLVLKEQERKEDARRLFIQALNVFPCFWSCWIELCRIIESEDLVHF